MQAREDMVDLCNGKICHFLRIWRVLPPACGRCLPAFGPPVWCRRIDGGQILSAQGILKLYLIEWCNVISVKISRYSHRNLYHMFTSRRFRYMYLFLLLLASFSIPMIWFYFYGVCVCVCVCVWPPPPANVLFPFVLAGSPRFDS